MKKSSPEVPPVTVWLVEDYAPFRNTVSRLLNSTPGLACTHIFATGEDALRSLATQPKPAVILLDVGLPGMNGIEFLAKVREAAPETRAVILTAFEDEEKIFRAICTGASGYLLKTATSEEITGAIAEAVAGGETIDFADGPGFAVVLEEGDGAGGAGGFVLKEMGEEEFGGPVAIDVHGPDVDHAFHAADDDVAPPGGVFVPDEFGHAAREGEEVGPAVFVHVDGEDLVAAGETGGDGLGGELEHGRGEQSEQGHLDTMILYVHSDNRGRQLSDPAVALQQHLAGRVARCDYGGAEDAGVGRD